MLVDYRGGFITIVDEEYEDYDDKTEYHEYIDEYVKNHKNADITKEIEVCRNWLESMQEMKGDSE